MAPALHRIEQSNNQFYCRLLRVHTASRSEALRSATGIGFHYYGWGSAGAFIPMRKLKHVASGTFKNGEAAEIHEFIGLANCWLGSGSSSERASYLLGRQCAQLPDFSIRHVV
ncbi:MAG: hypothetical protein A2X94_12635 [Bdellovibrionales bacterium GWB1_55_8]|nr:MAG: hypothetical protein A2X94_12635 [Bdellovibrionales bacterium GWB1_55_8]